MIPPLHESQRAVDAVRDRRPDVVLMDIEFRGSMTGIEATRQIKTGRHRRRS
jgi:CheY-like chemotaxis protein